MDTINMRKRRNWLGREVFEIDDSQQKPKTFREREEEAIGRLFYGWAALSLIPALVVGGLYLIPYEGSAYPYWFRAPVMFLGLLLICNVPNLALAIIRSIALAVVTYGRE